MNLTIIFVLLAGFIIGFAVGSVIQSGSKFRGSLLGAACGLLYAIAILFLDGNQILAATWFLGSCLGGLVAASTSNENPIKRFFYVRSVGRRGLKK